MERTATGFVWLDRLTAPWWRWRSWWSLRQIDRMLGIGGDEASRRRQRRELWDRLNPAGEEDGDG